MQNGIVDTPFVRAGIARGALLWDVRDEGAYARRHIPGAINVGVPTDELRDGNTEDYLPPPQPEKILGGAGIDPAREIVVYGTRGSSAPYFAQLTLRYLGGKQAYVFHDGIEGWRAAAGSCPRCRPRRRRWR